MSSIVVRQFLTSTFLNMASESGANLDNPTSKPLEIAIIGGGIGGLTLLLGLLNHTDPKIIKPHIYEAAAEFSEIGAGVGFGPNALQALGIVLPELQERFFTLATDAYADVIDGVKRPIWNEMFMGMDGKSEKCPLKAGDRIMNVCFDARKQNWKKNVHRARWLEQMVETLPGGTGAELVTFGKRCTDVQRQENGRGFIIKFADGTEAKADAVVGCDGVKSRVRQILLTMNDDEQAINPRFSGKYAYRGLIPIDEAVAAIGEVANRTHMWYGYDGHFVCFPIDKGKVLNVVAFHTKADGKWDSMDWVLPATVEEALEDFADWPENIRKMVGAIRKPDKWMLFEHPPAKSYCDESGRICLLGDCAHAR